MNWRGIQCIWTKYCQYRLAWLYENQSNTWLDFQWCLDVSEIIQSFLLFSLWSRVRLILILDFKFKTDLLECQLYICESRYTSIGSKSNTEKNQKLLRSDGSYAPAYQLVDCDTERTGRDWNELFHSQQYH
jgi:hypothetical protein